MLDDVEVDSWLASLENELTRSVLSASHTIGLAVAQVRKVAREEQQQGPIEPNLKTARPGWKLEQIDVMSNKLGDETSEMKVEYLCHC